MLHIRIGIIGLTEKDHLVLRSFAALLEGRLPMEPDFLTEDASPPAQAWIVNMDSSEGRAFLTQRAEGDLYIEASQSVDGQDARSLPRLRLPIRLQNYLNAMTALTELAVSLSPAPKPDAAHEQATRTAPDIGHIIRSARQEHRVLRLYQSGALVAAIVFSGIGEAFESPDFACQIGNGLEAITDDIPLTAVERRLLAKPSDSFTILWAIAEGAPDLAAPPTVLEQDSARFRLTRWPPVSLHADARAIIRFASLAMRPTSLTEIARRSSLGIEQIRRYCGFAFFAGIAELVAETPPPASDVPRPSTAPAGTDARNRLGVIKRLRLRLGI